MDLLKTIEYVDGCVRLIDQTQLPTKLVYEDILTVEQMYDAIKVLKVRGAPAIGIAGAYGLYVAVKDFPIDGNKSDFFKLLEEKAKYLEESRPTAVNLSWAINRVKKVVYSLPEDYSINKIVSTILNESNKILEEDRSACKSIGKHGFDILKDAKNLITHCNAGGLATSEYGTALAPMYVAKENGKEFHVYVDETRPLLQGARITAFELSNAGIPVTLICDNMSASVMSEKGVDAVIVGADRIASNGDTANKIGTYGLAIIAKAHNVPFYVAAPVSTFDLSIKTGKEIPIEERDSNEISNFFGRQTAPENINTYNPAFDVTPNNLIAGIITENGVLYPPYTESIKNSCK